MKLAFRTPLVTLAACAAFTLGCRNGGGSSGYAGCDAAARVYCDAAQPVAVKAGQQFVVVVRATPGTGYSWRFARPVDGALLRFIDNWWTADPSREPLAGATGNEAWKFKALAAGTATIALEYVSSRTNAPTIGDIRVFTVLVH